MENTSQGLGLLLHDAARTVRRRFEVRTAEFGLSSAQWRMMVHVCKMGGAPQSRFADMLEVEPISVSRLLDRMEALGWVTRGPDPADRRVRMVLPTPKALAAFDHIKSVADDVYAEALQGLSLAERQTLLTGLGRIVVNLSTADPVGTKDTK